MVKSSEQDPQDNSLQMKIRQYLISGRRLPSKENPNPKVICMRFLPEIQWQPKADFGIDHKATIQVEFKKIKQTQTQHGQILAVQELVERRNTNVKAYGIVIKYQSRTTVQRIQRYYIKWCCVLIMYVSVLTKSADIKRGKTNQYRGDSIKFPIVKTVPRASHKNFRTVFKAKRPNLYRS